MKHWIPKALLALTLPLAWTGCKTKGPSFQPGFEVLVEVDKSLKSGKGESPSVEVHIVILDVSEGLKMQKYSMTEYWNPQRSEDRILKYPLYFGPGKPDLQTLERNDDIWRRWQQQMGPLDNLWMFVVADLKGAWEDKEGSADPRRIILPLRSEDWPDRRQIHISMRREGMVNLTPRIPRSAN